MPLDQVDVAGATAMFWGLSAHLGTAVPQTAAGDRIFHVRDEGYAENHPQARGPSSRKRLSFHTDRCDVIAFCCLQQAKSGGENHVLSARRLYDEIHARRPDLAEVLQQPFYYQRHNVDPANRSAYYQQPVFSFYEGHFTGQLLRVLIERAYAAGEVPPMSPLQREALDFLEATADDPTLYVEFRQEPGDVVLMNNLTTFHRRTEFEDHSDFDRRRHLLRIWLATPISRPLDPLFAASYGSTAAGSIRGGMRTAH
jgi:alpha-ketoglutarate-dependent taurine dioxygenase